jgi:hypothetical protein
MASTGGDKLNPILQPNTPINPGNNLGSTTNKYASFHTHNFNTTTLNVTRRVIADEFIFGQAYSVTGGPITINTTATDIYTITGPNSGFIYIYKSDYSTTFLCSFHYTTQGSTWCISNTLNTGTTITLSNSTTTLRATATGSAVTNVYYKIFFSRNLLMGV